MFLVILQFDSIISFVLHPQDKSYMRFYVRFLKNIKKGKQIRERFCGGHNYHKAKTCKYPNSTVLLLIKYSREEKNKSLAHQNFTTKIFVKFACSKTKSQNMNKHNKNIANKI